MRSNGNGSEQTEAFRMSAKQTRIPQQERRGTLECSGRKKDPNNVT
ncbi:MAG: hypothetical protein SO117_00745 [Frisingicoccus sp.]|nr:hypothetical protein [Frisingicoccus sp.]